MRKGITSGPEKQSGPEVGRSASSLIDTGKSDALSRPATSTSTIESEGLPEPRPMKLLLTWCGTRVLGEGAGREASVSERRGSACRISSARDTVTAAQGFFRPSRACRIGLQGWTNQPCQQLCCSRTCSVRLRGSEYRDEEGKFGVERWEIVYWYSCPHMSRIVDRGPRLLI